MDIEETQLEAVPNDPKQGNPKTFRALEGNRV